MSLPSKYAPQPLGPNERRRTITVGAKRSPSNYTVRKLEERQPEGKEVSEDVEMVPVDNTEEVNIISDYVNRTRSSGHFESADMELDTYMLRTETVTVEGNLSYLIVDTNFILSHLAVLDQLKNIGVDHGLRLVVPIEVVHELDGLKRLNKAESSGEKVSTLARKANDWVHKCLACSVPTVQGQGMKQRLNKLLTHDDAILDCCLYFQQEYPNTLQVLMSNDKNLCAKALLNGILTVTYERGMSASLIAQKVQHENLLRFGRLNAGVQLKEVEVPVPAARPVYANAMETIYAEVETLVTSAVHRCMVSNYEDELEMVRGYSRDTVSTLQAAAQAMQRFWLLVFSAYFQRKRGLFDKQGNLEHPRLALLPLRADLELFVDLWSEVLQKIYLVEMEIKELHALEKLIERWRAMAT